jgi:hypothetical protein
MNWVCGHTRQIWVSVLLVSFWCGIARSGEEKNPPSPQLPSELQGAKIYRIPEEGKKGGPPENPVIYRNLAYEEINFERLILKLSVSVKPFDRSATVSKIYFQDVRANGIPVEVETFEQAFKISNRDTVDLPAPLKCTITFSDLESLAPLKEIINQDKITVTGQSFVEVRLSTLQKIAVRAKRLVLPVPLKEEVPLQMFSGSPLLRMAAHGVLDTLTDPASAPAIALAKEHLAKIAGIRALEQKGLQSLYFLYSEYILRDPKTGASEKFSQSGTGFLVSADGKLATAKRVVEPWKFDPQTVLMITRDRLEVDPKSIRLAAWPAGATILAEDGSPDLNSAFSSERQTLRVLKTLPDRLEKQDYEDPDSGEKTTLEIHAGGEDDIAVVQLTGSNSQPLELAADTARSRAESRLSLLGFPFGLSQTQVNPKPVAVTSVGEEGFMILDVPLHPGQSGAPLLTPEGKVVAICAEPNRCVSAEFVRKLIP